MHRGICNDVHQRVNVGSFLVVEFRSDLFFLLCALKGILKNNFIMSMDYLIRNGVIMF